MCSWLLSLSSLAAYIFQVINIWRIFETRFLAMVPAVLIHVGVILSIIIALWRKARQRTGVTEECFVFGDLHLRKLVR